MQVNDEDLNDMLMYINHLGKYLNERYYLGDPAVNDYQYDAFSRIATALFDKYDKKGLVQSRFDRKVGK